VSGLSGEASIYQPRADAVVAVYGTAPIIALYRAGEREEALRSGYLTGLWRYKSAAAAGEQPDPRWVLGDRAWNEVEFMYLVLLHADREAALLLYDELNRRQGWLADVSDAFWHRRLALFAALAGRRAEMLDHLAAAAGVLDRPDQNDPYWALNLAREWRQAEFVVSRTPS
jgi:hypothetical protein